MAKQQTLHCSFCGRSREEVKILIAGQEGHICENCVEHAQEIIGQELSVFPDSKQSGSASNKLTVKKPIEIKKFLDEYVIGQDDAKKIFVALSSSWLRASQSGVFISNIKLGDMVQKGQIIGSISNPFVKSSIAKSVKPVADLKQPRQ